MRKIYMLFAFCLATTVMHAQWTQMGNEFVGDAVDDRLGTSLSISSDGYTVAMGAPYNDDGPGSNSGQVKVYDWDGANWIQRGSDINGESGDDTEGTERYLRISADGNSLAIGAIANDGGGSNSGHVRVFDWDGSNWVQRGMDINGEAADDYSGSVSFSADANTLAIGAVGNDGGGSNSGHVRIFDWDGSNWVQRGTDINGGSGAASGESVDLSADGNIVAIGTTNAEVVRILEWNGSAWVQKGASLYAEAAGDYYGQDLDLTPDGNTILIGAQLNDGNGANSGQIRVFDWDGSAWVQRGIDLDGDAALDYFGTTVSISSDGNTVAAGAYMNDEYGAEAGKVKIFHWDGSSWVFDSDILYAGPSSYFGTTVSLSANGEILAIGSMGALSNRGLVVVFGVPSCNTSNTFSINKCGLYTVPSGDETYTAVGSYQVMDTVLNSQGCDSILTINLTINTPSAGSETITSCNSYMWSANSTNYTSTGTYIATLTNAAGCDSVVTLNLTITNSNTGIDIQTACDSYLWIDGTTYTSSNNTATYTLTNSAGCDSVVTLDLTINTVDVSVNDFGLTLTANNAGASYQWIDCNNGNSPITGETNQSFTATADGSYAVIIDDGTCVDTSACFVIVGIGIDKSDFITATKIFPNPTSGEFIIQSDQEIIENISILNLMGEVIYCINAQKNMILVDISDQPRGSYFIKIKFKNKFIIEQILLN